MSLQHLHFLFALEVATANLCRPDFCKDARGVPTLSVVRYGGERKMHVVAVSVCVFCLVVVFAALGLVL